MKNAVPLDVIEEFTPDLAKRIKAAELKDGYRYGGAMFLQDSGHAEVCFVDVSFYPKTKWWLQLSSSDDKIELTRELYERVSQLQL